MLFCKRDFHNQVKIAKSVKFTALENFALLVIEILKYKPCKNFMRQNLMVFFDLQKIKFMGE